jgi:hypothetical protein
VKPSRRALFWLLISYGFWGVLATHVGGARAALFDYTDHWSHYSQAILFLSHGFDAYRVPATHVCKTPSPAAVQRLPPVRGCEWCVTPGVSEERPLCINFQQLRNGFPPGVFLYSLPEVLLFEGTKLSLRAINLFSIFKYLAASHLLIWLLFKLVFEPPEGDRQADPGEGWLRYGLFGLLYLEVLKWTLAGFYDPLAVAAIFLAVWQLRERHGANALLAMSAAIFLHFRALWFVPLFAFAAWRAFENREWKSGGGRFYAKLAASAVMSGLTLYAFVLLYPGLTDFLHNNPAFFMNLSATNTASWDLLIPIAPVLLYLAWSRQWTFLACAAWQLFTITRTFEIHEWHFLHLLPIFAVARLEGKRGSMVAAAILYLTEAIVIFFNEVPLPGWHLTNLIHLWQPWW